ncbi:MAG: hypothetical protein WC373_11780 [Smithella sp.]|jgi:hypothetical protein
MAEAENKVEIKIEYQGLAEISKRLRKSKDFIRGLVTREDDPLPAKLVGREYWITETKIQEWLNK